VFAVGAYASGPKPVVIVAVTLPFSETVPSCIVDVVVDVDVVVVVGRRFVRKG
jgi:hypothetical protein